MTNLNKEMLREGNKILSEIIEYQKFIVKEMDKLDLPEELYNRLKLAYLKYVDDLKSRIKQKYKKQQSEQPPNYCLNCGRDINKMEGIHLPGELCDTCKRFNKKMEGLVNEMKGKVI